MKAKLNKVIQGVVGEKKITDDYSPEEIGGKSWNRDIAYNSAKDEIAEREVEVDVDAIDKVIRKMENCDYVDEKNTRGLNPTIDIAKAIAEEILKGNVIKCV